MTRRDYVAIAAIIQDQRANHAKDGLAVQYTLDDIADDLARLMSRDNPRFDRERFLRAAGVEFNDAPVPHAESPLRELE
jgi:hypothetical protein